MGRFLPEFVKNVFKKFKLSIDKVKTLYLADERYRVPGCRKVTYAGNVENHLKNCGIPNGCALYLTANPSECRRQLEEKLRAGSDDAENEPMFEASSITDEMVNAQYELRQSQYRSILDEQFCKEIIEDHATAEKIDTAGFENRKKFLVKKFGQPGKTASEIFPAKCKQRGTWCFICEKFVPASAASSLQKHLEAFHPRGAKCSTLTKRKNECNNILKKAHAEEDKKTLEKHSDCFYRIDEKSFECIKCDTTFECGITDMVRHANQHRNNEFTRSWKMPSTGKLAPFKDHPDMRLHEIHLPENMSRCYMDSERKVTSAKNSSICKFYCRKCGGANKKSSAEIDDSLSGQKRAAQVKNILKHEQYCKGAEAGLLKSTETGRENAEEMLKWVDDIEALHEKYYPKEKLKNFKHKIVANKIQVSDPSESPVGKKEKKVYKTDKERQEMQRSEIAAEAEQKNNDSLFNSLNNYFLFEQNLCEEMWDDSFQKSRTANESDPELEELLTTIAEASSSSQQENSEEGVLAGSRKRTRDARSQCENTTNNGLKVETIRTPDAKRNKKNSEGSPIDMVKFLGFE